MENKPVRVQLRRTKGWRMPPNTVKVTRPGKWGNNFIVYPLNTVPRPMTHEVAFEVGPNCREVEGPPKWFEDMVRPHYFLTHEDAAKQAVAWFERFANERPEYVRMVRRELRGKNLACFCPLDKPCHADVLLEIANSKEARDGS